MHSCGVVGLALMLPHTSAGTTKVVDLYPDFSSVTGAAKPSADREGPRTGWDDSFYVSVSIGIGEK